MSDRENLRFRLTARTVVHPCEQVWLWWHVRHQFSLRRWARRLGIDHSAAALDKRGHSHLDLVEYVLAREAGLAPEQIVALRNECIDVGSVAAAIAAGLVVDEALLICRLSSVDIDDYSALRRAGLTVAEVLHLVRRAVKLDAYAAVRYYRGRDDQALAASAAGISGVGYRICREVGMTHEEILDRRRAGVDLWLAALEHRRAQGAIDDDFDRFLVKAASWSARR